MLHFSYVSSARYLITKYGKSVRSTKRSLFVHLRGIRGGETTYYRQMTSSKGKPTDPELREKIKEEVKQESNKSGGGEGQWAAWKASKLAKEYEKQGGEYENEAGSKNEPKKGAPQHKSESKKKAETGEDGYED